MDLYMKLGKCFAEHHDVLVTEDIHVKQLVGKSLRRMRLHDVTFHELRRITEYQLEKCGEEIVFVNPAFTSTTCARCGHVKGDLTLTDRVFGRPKCGWVTDRDYNAPLNVLRRAGWEAPLVPVDPRPLPIGQGGTVMQEAPSVRTE
ncbi:hypothetical protein HS1genome_2043 [Sulfodiicoccus acidiphilus]|uniref:Cas12f1-like TNB domain-containing protein n=1 Tax=Sulfodiicoccus acidiphilus TaxID=1670455 RepID=A0A348B652_9CREN|nr:hypothetical protein HS1genome_2043 [Sulfodiicoccus acidiphilus]GGU02023.1 hypothetical protein GCM10007116_18920 [Sulfodiicoccus acidiphilus]